MPADLDEDKDRWDCETILSTYSNLENHPRLIRARRTKPVAKIELDPKTGLPIVDGQKISARHRPIQPKQETDKEEEQPVRVTITRPKDEAKDDKKARKQAVKAERQARRVDKKANKERFSSEIKQQAKRLSEAEKKKMRKL
ncbi:hypothetical protein NM688_g603 [Phlebia brevispora]|uniref:Uncharacterized protein n=1 Tax=Phlebia brevispora TaxID=194682 RepID=A0ACC1TE46_9APHY|nr:hypothetical protein NM688_g603 [Phlebia brevispora]